MLRIRTSCLRIQIRIQNAQKHTDPNPQHWSLQYRYEQGDVLDDKEIEGQAGYYLLTYALFSTWHICQKRSSRV
jgi:hypothetical protein